MDTVFESIPFVAAIALLVTGVLRLRRFLFISSFIVLLMACIFALANDGSSAAFSFIGNFVLLFGLACAGLSSRLKPGSFISRGGLGAIGALLFFIGLLGTMLI
ncbi:MAG: hypothetical protein ABSG59_19765 [Verrucomicrobiota bacterium]|jgi:hypothetical protein